MRAVTDRKYFSPHKFLSFRRAECGWAVCSVSPFRVLPGGKHRKGDREIDEVLFRTGSDGKGVRSAHKPDG